MIQGPNKFIWYELMTTDQDAAEAFYRAVVGWNMADAGQPRIGRFAMLADPGGAMFYLLTPFPRQDVPPPAEPTTPGLVSWHELYSSISEEAAFAFYSGQFGWETVELMDMGPMGKCRIFGADGVPTARVLDNPQVYLLLFLSPKKGL